MSIALPGVTPSRCEVADTPSHSGVCGDDLVSTRPASSDSDCSSSNEDYAAVYSESDCLGDYKEIPHNMGRCQPPLFTKSPPKSKPSFSSTIEKHVECESGSSKWVCMIANMIDHSDLPKAKSEVR